ncbi:alpha/beta hydrolase [Actinokineospora auranticolor]|uniref:Alpha/beta hydrolase family protein DUF1100 n=1 Tax=Actinokineospora auranticolor TaxID=155976 RepID=A0A2S6GLQ3_9PSEU|nr:alpha/beta hydrolase [Actinokineospora auranticolor]PPK66164.1 alpha/beta hydrolase family protein DUF1100 [Actinokineospora auranticolor]
MNDLAELKRYVVAHGRAQNLPPAHLARLLGGIEREPSWAGAWVAAGERLEAAGDLLAACGHYNLGRFPFVDGESRREALRRCVAAFDRWRARVPGIEPLELRLPGGRVRAWTTGLDRDARKPLLVVTGGIVSVKEQWAPVLLELAAHGMAGLVTELPGVGENTLRYDREAWTLYPALLDAVRDRADTDDAHLLALSFSGHAALRAAARDPRIRTVLTAGAPVRDFFTDRTWQRQVPKVTVDTLAHLTGTTPDTVFDHLSDWALLPGELAAVDAGIGYVASARDEIIPRGEVRHLRAHARRVRVTTHDDVHGSPNHFAETRLWILLSLMRSRGTWGRERVALAARLALRRLGNRARRG